MRDSEEIRFLDGTSQDTSAELAAAVQRERVDASKGPARWAAWSLAWSLLAVPPALVLLTLVPSTMAKVVGACALIASTVVALVLSLKRLMGR